jgi:uncharacterized protein (DUF924 family)
MKLHDAWSARYAQMDIDREITEKFGELLSRAERGELEVWGDANPRAATALVVLLDQFSRHVYRTQVCFNINMIRNLFLTIVDCL